MGATSMSSYRFPDAEIPTISEHVSPLINQLLAGRGVTPAEVGDFLAPNYEAHLHDPQLLNDIDAACTRIEVAMAAGETIAIFSDYDCDGIPGAVVLHDFFTAIGYTNTTLYIPHRHYEGFGMSTKAIDELKGRGTSLAITIDCGTSNIEEVAHAKSIGVDVIVTDHHEPEEVLPDAVAVVNPKLGEYPFPDLCGAAVAFKLAQAMLARGSYDIPPGHEKWWLDMVGVATIADMVPLRGENRVLAHYGLMVLKKSRRPGLQQLLKKNRLNQSFLTEEDIGFTIGPRINAASRMDTPEDAFHLLAEKDEVEAGKRVDHLERLNTDRKSQVALMTKELHKRLKTMEEVPPVIVVGSPEWRPSLVGLAANKVAEEFGRPAFVWGTDGNGVYKGSCRSGGTLSVVKLMQQAADSFIEYGGHHASGGFSVKEDHIFTFAEELYKAANALGDEAKVDETVAIDAELSLGEVNRFLINELSKLAPFGMGNHKPLFAFKNVTPVAVELFGKTKEHTKLRFNTDTDQLEAIAFFTVPEKFTHEPKVDVPCTMLAHVEESFFMGRKQIRMRVIDIIPVTE